MKKFVKIISVVMCALLLVTGFFFAPKNMTPFLLSSHAATTQADTIVGDYNYTGEVVYDYYGFGDFAVDSVESVSVQQGFALKFDLHVASAWSWLFSFYSTTKLSSRQYFDYLLFFGSGYNILIVASERHLYFETINTTTIDGVVYNNFDCFSDSGNIDYLMYISNCNMSVDSDLNVSFSRTKIEDYSGSSAASVLDMDSNTSFNLFETVSSNDFLYPYLQYYVGNHSYIEINTRLYPAASSQSFLSNNGTVLNLNFYRFNTSIFRYFNSQNVFFFNDVLQFIVNRPIYRVNNSLIIFNYDFFNSLKNINYTSFTLERDSYYYHINLDNYYFENNKFIQIHNSDLDNIVFDTYIIVSFISENVVPYSASVVYEDDSFLISHDIGFDFNFSYYVDPLVSSSGVYDYDFDKPSYKDASIEFSVVPPELHIPFLAWIENAFIFLLFYCPITSDIIELLHFDKFLGGLISIFDMFVDSQVGEFVLGCFAFLVLWYFLKSLLPSIVSSIRSRSSSSDDSMSSYYQKQSDNFMKALKYKPGRVLPFKWKAKDYKQAQIFKKPHYAAFHGKRNSQIKKSLVRMEKRSLQHKGKIRSE